MAWFTGCFFFQEGPAFAGVWSEDGSLEGHEALRSGYALHFWIR